MFNVTKCLVHRSSLNGGLSHHSLRPLTAVFYQHLAILHKTLTSHQLTGLYIITSSWRCVHRCCWFHPAALPLPVISTAWPVAPALGGRHRHTRDPGAFLGALVNSAREGCP